MSEALLPDPSPRLTAAYRAISARMSGLNFVNPALDVEAVGFAPWQSHWLGAMVTPWFINLMLLPREPSAWTSLPQGQTLRYRFPAGEYDFIASRNDDMGEYHMCSLISPVLDLADHPTARLVAQLALAALLDPANAVDAPVEGQSAIETMLQPAAAPLSKRDFLRGRFLRGEQAA
jgi:[NiFe] hydrogenase assembly HybE family chaperone